MSFSSSGLDRIVLTGALASFLAFILAQILLFRLIKQEKILKGLEILFLTSGLLNMALCFLLLGRESHPRTDIFLASAASLMIYGLACFVYVIGVYSMYESSIRLRLLREIAGNERGVTLEEILRRYNARVILRKRLARLVASGDLKHAEEGYEAGRSRGLLPFFTKGIKILRSIYGKPDVCRDS